MTYLAPFFDRSNREAEVESNVRSGSQLAMWSSPLSAADEPGVIRGRCVMPATVLKEAALKRALKEALVETLQEQRELFREIFAEVLEDFAVAEAIREGEGTKSATREEVFRILRAKPSERPSARASCGT
jgi:hypothetical protein